MLQWKVAERTLGSAAGVKNRRRFHHFHYIDPEQHHGAGSIICARVITWSTDVIQDVCGSRHGTTTCTSWVTLSLPNRLAAWTHMEKSVTLLGTAPLGVDGLVKQQQDELWEVRRCSQQRAKESTNARTVQLTTRKSCSNRSKKKYMQSWRSSLSNLRFVIDLFK